MKDSELSSRLSSNMFKYEAQDLEPKVKKNIIFIVLIIIFLIILGILLIVILTSNKDDNKKSHYNPFPKNEDLEFTEEEHRTFARKAAFQTIILATNNGGGLPLKKKDKVVLFGYGTNNTIYGGTGSGKVYDRGTSQVIHPVNVLEGIENFREKFFVVKIKAVTKLEYPDLNQTEI